MPSKPIPTITLGQLRADTQGYPDSFTIDFGGLSYLRIKQRAPTHLQVEFDQLVSLDGKGHVVVQNLE